MIMQKWEKMLAVQRMQEFISRHLKEVITLSDLARAAAYSPGMRPGYSKRLRVKRHSNTYAF
jgi:hypothetical protein